MPWATVLSPFVATLTAIAVVLVGVHASNEADRANFLREHRQVLYAEVLADLGRIQNDVEANLAAYVPRTTNYRTDDKDLVGALHQLQILGPDEVWIAASHARSALERDVVDSLETEFSDEQRESYFHFLEQFLDRAAAAVGR